MASGFRARPPSLSAGMSLSDYYKVEGLIRVAEGRMFYLVNDNRKDRANRRCWECGDENNLVDATHCGACNASLAVRRFLLSVHIGFNPDAYFQYFQKQISHRAFINPCDAFLYPEDRPMFLCSVVPYHGERFMLDEAAPLPMASVLTLAQRGIGLIAHLANQGIKLSWIHRSNFLVRGDDDFVLYDPQVAEVQNGPVPPDQCAKVIKDLGGVLRKYTPLEEPTWQEFFQGVEDGLYLTPAEFGQALQEEYNRHPRKKRTEHAGMTDVGLVRQQNEDNWGWARLCEGTDLFVVADGMGGHDAGEIASKIAVDTLLSEAGKRLNVTPRPGIDTLENILDESFQEGNNRVKSTGEERGSDMGTTLVCCMVVDDAVALCANVGDSRAYLIRGGQLHQITRDHSLVQRMVEQNRLTALEARNHPHSNILLRTVGTERNVEIDIFRVELEAGDRLLLCSDGLWGEVEDAEIESILNQSDNNRVVARELIRAAHHGGGKDNISVVVVSVPGSLAEAPSSSS